jgi:hypothetical protein
MAYVTAAMALMSMPLELAPTTSAKVVNLSHILFFQQGVHACKHAYIP